MRPSLSPLTAGSPSLTPVGDTHGVSSGVVQQPRVLCVICHEDDFSHGSIHITFCDHQFHQECIDRWLLRNPTCPTCRAPQTVPHAPVLAAAPLEEGEEPTGVLGSMVEGALDIGATGYRLTFLLRRVVGDPALMHHLFEASDVDEGLLMRVLGTPVSFAAFVLGATSDLSRFALGLPDVRMRHRVSFAVEDGLEAVTHSVSVLGCTLVVTPFAGLGALLGGGGWAMNNLLGWLFPQA
jgi:hypothetical protein